MDLVVHKVSSEAALSSLAPEWRALESASQNMLPFRTAEWTLAWWKHLRRKNNSLCDSLSVRAVRTRDGELVGVAPLMVTERPGRGFVRARCLNFIGADRNVTELRGPLFSTSHRDVGFVALRDDLLRNSQEWDWIVWSGLPRGSHAASELFAGDAGITRDIPYYTLALSGNWESFKSSRSRNVKESLRKCYNSLKRDGLSFSFEAATSRNDIKAGLRDFFRLHSARADLDGTIQHANAFAADRERAFLVDVCERLSERNIARVFRLRVGDHVVAARVGFIQNRCLYLYYSGYEPEFGKYSVATTMVAEALKYAFLQGVETVNLSTGTDVSKTRWSPDEWVLHEGVGTSPRPLGRLAHGAYNAINQLLRRKTSHDHVSHRK